jgi:hypothetical protein
MEFFTYLGITWAIWTVVKMFFTAKEIDNRIDRVRELADRTVRVVKLEPLPNQKTMLAYDAENDSFLGQGDSDEEIKERIMQRFPDKIFVLNDKVFTARPQGLEIRA